MSVTRPAAPWPAVGLNGQPDSHESYQAHERRAFNGLALVLIQSTARSGGIILKASAPSLAGAQINIFAR